MGGGVRGRKKKVGQSEMLYTHLKLTLVARPGFEWLRQGPAVYWPCMELEDPVNQEEEGVSVNLSRRRIHIHCLFERDHISVVI